MADDRQVWIKASMLEPVGSRVLIPQLSVADQCDRGHTWSEHWSGGSPGSQVGLLLALQEDLGRHARSFESPTAATSTLQFLREVRGFEVN